MAVVEYDGTGYHGFQFQPDLPTIQGEIEQALIKLTGRPVRIIGAGRTDSGVHARGQVINFPTEWSHPIAELQRALNATLPPAIAVREMQEVAPDFHARFSAVARQYRYTIWNGPVRSPFLARYAYWYRHSLRLDLMAEAGQRLTGNHDFASFGRSPQGENTVREVQRIQCQRENSRVHIEVLANAFLRGMMRSIVAVLLLVGADELTVEDVETILLAKDRSMIKYVPPPHGLCLMRVIY